MLLAKKVRLFIYVILADRSCLYSTDDTLYTENSTSEDMNIHSSNVEYIRKFIGRRFCIPRTAFAY